MNLSSLSFPETQPFSQYLTTLSEKGQFLYLTNDQNIEDSWVILDQEMLLSEVNCLCLRKLQGTS